MCLGAPIVRVVVTDANILINLIQVDSLDILVRLPGYEFVIPNEVTREVTDAGQRQALDNLLSAGLLREVAVDDTEALAVFVELIAIMGSGEAACLSLAQTRGWLIASDERRVFRREALARLGPGRIVNTAGIFVLAIHAGVLSVEDADKIKSELERYRFRMPFRSFRDIV